jgi:chemotaxis protein MotB
MSGGGGHRRGGHEEEHEEHENHERWLVSYADMMTLLMVLFIVLFAISQVDQKKFAALKTGLSAGFGAPVEIMPGATSLLDPGGAVAPDSVNLAGSAGGTTTTANINPQEASDPSTATIAKALAEKSKAEVAKEANNLKEAQKKLKAALKKAGLPKSATFRFDERGLIVTIATDNVLFKSGSDQLQPQGRKILNTIAPTLLKLPNRLSIDGHTNSVPIHTKQFPSNWYLSSDRANGVLQYLHNNDGLPYGRMQSTGYADTEPRLPKSNPKALTANRRVEIVVIARVDDSLGKAIAQTDSK